MHWKAQIKVGCGSLHAKRAKQLFEFGKVWRDGGVFLGQGCTGQSNVVQKTAGGAVGSVNRTDKAPGFGQQFSHRRRFHFGEVLSAMHTAKVRKVPREVQLVGHYCKASRLLQVKLRLGDQVTRCKEVFHFLSNGSLLVDEFLKVERIANRSRVKLGVFEVFQKPCLSTA